MNIAIITVIVMIAVMLSACGYVAENLTVENKKGE